MGEPATGDYWEDGGLVRLWISFLLAPAAWALNELIGYALVKPVCSLGHKVILSMLSLGMLALVIVGATLAWTCLVQLRGAAEHGGTHEDRSYFMAHVALGFNLLIALLILTAAVPPFLLNPCE